MPSNSIRVDAKLFSKAREEGLLMSRSASQQIEHWARLGAALEATGLPVADVARMLRRTSQDGVADGASRKILPPSKKVPTAPALKR